MSPQKNQKDFIEKNIKGICKKVPVIIDPEKSGLIYPKPIDNGIYEQQFD